LCVFIFLFYDIVINNREYLWGRVSMLIFMEAISCTCNLMWVVLFLFFMSMFCGKIVQKEECVLADVGNNFIKGNFIGIWIDFVPTLWTLILSYICSWRWYLKRFLSLWRIIIDEDWSKTGNSASSNLNEHLYFMHVNNSFHLINDVSA